MDNSYQEAGQEERDKGDRCDATGAAASLLGNPGSQSFLLVAIKHQPVKQPQNHHDQFQI